MDMSLITLKLKDPVSQEMHFNNCVHRIVITSSDEVETDTRHGAAGCGDKPVHN